MKKLIIALSIILAASLYSTSKAQSVNINVNVNLDKQPAWGPTGYSYAGYYYLPDINVYYDINDALYYYLSGNKWISAQYLPDNYRKSDFYSLYKVVINDSQPWLKNKTHRKEYASYKGDKTQTPIRNSSDTKYNTSKRNTNAWVNTNQNSNSSKQKTQNRTDDKNKTNGKSQNQNNKTSSGKTSNGKTRSNNSK